MEKNHRIKSYVLRASRMSKGQREAIDKYFVRYSIPYIESEIDFDDYFNKKQIFIEIGFGMGDATAEIAFDNPEKSYLGIEVHKPGIGKLLSEINRMKLKNIRIIDHDAVEVLEKMIPDSSVSGFHIFFPDPWPKKKHRKRRIFNENFLEILVSKLQIDGYIYTSTDWDDYADQMEMVLTGNIRVANASLEGNIRPFTRPVTSFEKKGIKKNHRISEFYFKRVN